MSDEHAIYAQWDAAYVLGALSPADRRAFEAHLATCERCSAAVVELAPMPGLLSLAGAPSENGQIDDAATEEALASPPVDLVDRILRSERRRRIRQRLLVIGAAAAVVVAILIVAVPALQGRVEPAATVALEAQEATPMRVDIDLVPVAWGTRLEVTCDYPEGETWGDEDGPWAYGLVITNVDGTSEQVATWTAVDGRAITLEAATGLPLDEIALVEVVTASGVVLLSGAPVDAE